MLEIEAAGRGTLTYPTEQCCNCGTVDGKIRIVQSVLRFQLRLPLPYCDGCAETAHRMPPLLGGTVLAWMLLFMLALSGASHLPWLKPLGFGGVLLLVAAVAAAAIWAWRRVVARPRGTQTSYYQPVRLHRLGQVLAFTHDGYGASVLAANPLRCTLVSARVPVAQAVRAGGRGSAHSSSASSSSIRRS